MAPQRSKPAPQVSAFISHAKADAKKAQAIAEGLEKRGFKCWIAPRDVKAGRSYGDEIIRGIESARVFVLVLSKASNDSAFVAREVERAVSKKKPVLAIRIADVEPAPSLELFVSSTQWIDAFPGRLAPHISRLADLIAEEEGAAPGVSGGESPPQPRRLPKWALPFGAAASVLLVLGAGVAFWPERQLPLIGPQADPAVLTEPGWQKGDAGQQVAAAKPSDNTPAHGAWSSDDSGDTEMIIGGRPPKTKEQVAGVQTQEFDDEIVEGALERPVDRTLGLDPQDATDKDFRACEKSSGDDAVAACDRAIASGKFAGRSLSYLYNDRGFLLMQKGAINAALADLNKAIEIDATNFYAFWNRGAVYAAKGDRVPAQQDLITALSLNPDGDSKAKIEQALVAVTAEAAQAAKSKPTDKEIISVPSWGNEGERAAGVPAYSYPADAMPASPPMATIPAIPASPSPMPAAPPPMPVR